MSPMKASSDGAGYFVGEISDEAGSVPTVGFDEDQQRKIAQHESSKQVISLENCEIEKSCFGDNMEVIVKQSTMIDRPK